MRNTIVWWSRLLSLTSVRVQVCTALATNLIMQLFYHSHTFAEAPNGPQGNTNDICWPNTFPRLVFNVLLFPANNCKSNGRVSLCLLTIHCITQIQYSTSLCTGMIGYRITFAKTKMGFVNISDTGRLPSTYMSLSILFWKWYTSNGRDLICVKSNLHPFCHQNCSVYCWRERAQRVKTYRSMSIRRRWVRVFLQSGRLTRFPLDKMDAISQTIFSDIFFVNEKFCILIKISLKWVPNGPIDNNPAFV